METKVCNKCGEEKELSEFNKARQNKDGYCGKCKVCEQKYKKEWEEKNKISIIEKRKEYYKQNKLSCNEKSKLYSELNKSKISEKHRLYYKNKMGNLTLEERELYNKKANNYRNINKEKVNETNRKYHSKKKDEINKRSRDRGVNLYKNRGEYYKKYKSEQREVNPLFKLRYNLRASINYHLKNIGTSKKTNTINILGCSIEEFKLYLESKFESWMSWDNYGNPKDGIIEPNKTWDIDHKIPLGSVSTEEDIIKLNHYTNLQPLCSYINRYIKKHHILN